MHRAALALAALAAVLPSALAAPAHASGAIAPPPAVLGHDVSFPQCGGALPASAAVAIVGVNDGIATGTNPCLVEQLAWARLATLGTATGTDAVQLYVNTGNPGHAAAWWPTGDTTRGGAPVPAAAGTCTGGQDAACAYVYGWSLAVDDLARVPAGTAARWWLDVETINSWSADRPANLASVEGMADAFAAAGAHVGLYSTQRQWSSVVGDVPANSSLSGLPSWLAGAVTIAGATERCTADGLVPGGRVLLAQYVSGDVDGDVLCHPAATPAPPPVVRDGFWARIG